MLHPKDTKVSMLSALFSIIKYIYVVMSSGIILITLYI